MWLLAAIPRKAWILIVVHLFAAAIIVGSYGYGYDKAKAKAEKEQAELMARATEKEREYEQQISGIRAKAAQENATAAARDARTIRALRNGAKRLRLATADCTPAKANASAVGTDGAGSAELAPSVAATLWRIAGDGDRAIRKLTALQAWARSAVDLCGD